MKFVASGLATLLLATWMPSVVLGQDLPRFQHARQHARPAAYEVVCFHAGPPTADDLSLQQQVEALAQSPANVTCTLVDVARDPKLWRCSSAARQAWLSRSEPSRPRYLMLAPTGTELYGDNDPPPAVLALVKSPARDRLVSELTAKCAGVFVFVPGDDAAANADCEKLVAAVVQEFNDINSTSDAANAPRAAWLAVDRQNLAEDWFVRSLRLLAESPSSTTSSEPLVCLVYGRARALLAAVGPQISHDRLHADWRSILEVENGRSTQEFAGLDLPVQHDWNRAFADKSAQSSVSPRRDEMVKPASAEKKVAGESSPSPAARPAQEPLPFSFATLSMGVAVGMIALLWLMFVIIRPS